MDQADCIQGGDGTGGPGCFIAVNLGGVVGKYEPNTSETCPVDDTNTGLCYEQTDAEFVVRACPDGAWDPNADDGKGGTGAWVVPEEIYYCRPSDPAKPTFDKSEWFATEVQQGRLLTCPEVL